VPLICMAGGYALSGRGPVWARIACGVVALSAIPAWAMTASLISPTLAIDTPNGAWVAVYYYSFLALLAYASAIPHRAIAPLRNEPPGSSLLVDTHQQGDPG
jgi:hypothetical protein